MAHISVDEFLRYATHLESERLTTAAGRASFTIRVLPRGLEVTPESSRKSRLVSREMIKAVLAAYEQSRNLQPGQYQSITFDASYLLGILSRYLREHQAG